MILQKNIQIPGKHNKNILTDVYFKETQEKKPLVVFCHGYKGYKDWGAFDLMARKFAAENFFMVKFNFSHNGGTMDDPIDFPDLEAFGRNNYSIEQDDLGAVLDWVLSQSKYAAEIATDHIVLVGHSRGGGAVVLKAAVDKRASKIITWGAVSDYATRFPEGPILAHWKKEGVAFIENARTKQQMPHYIQFYEDFIANKNRLDIPSAAKSLKIPHLIAHGSADSTVPIKEGEQLNEWSPQSKFFRIENGDHVFGAKQPWDSDQLPVDFSKVIDASIAFIKAN
ncbi:MAG: alpha/beta hydrolase family protein [Flavicella sp.]